MMQVSFIDSICLPIYEVGVSLLFFNLALWHCGTIKEKPFSVLIFSSNTHTQAFAQLSDRLVPLVDGVRQNKHHWLEIAESKYPVEHCTNHDRTTTSTSDNEETSEQADQ